MGLPEFDRFLTKRPDYAEETARKLVEVLAKSVRACDVGAGVEHLTRMLRSVGREHIDEGVAETQYRFYIGNRSTT